MAPVAHGRTPGRRKADRLAKGDHAEAARLADDAIDQSREVQRAKYELTARLVLGRALMALGQPERGIDELRAALDGIRRLGHQPTLWRAWWTLGTALAQTGRMRRRPPARSLPATWAPERSGPLLAAEPSREILSRPPAPARKPRAEQSGEHWYYWGRCAKAEITVSIGRRYLTSPHPPAPGYCAAVLDGMLKGALIVAERSGA